MLHSSTSLRRLFGEKPRRGTASISPILCAVTLCILAGQTLADDAVQVDATQRALADLNGAYPGLVMDEFNGRTKLVGGRPMAPAATAREAAEGWLAAHGRVFGAGDLEISLRDVTPTRGGDFTIFSYDQSIEGVAVEFSNIKIRVMRSKAIQGGAEVFEVVKAAAKVAARPQAGFKEVAITGEGAQQVVQAMSAYKTLPQWSAPEMVVYQGEGDFQNWIEPTLAWRFQGEAPVGAFARKFSFLVDSSTGELLHARNEILHIDVTGRVQARATPFGPNAATADHTGNTPTVVPVPNIRVRINGNNANSAFTDVNGNFTIPWGGSTPVTVDASVSDGRWVRVVETLAGQPLATASASVTPGTPVTLNLNPAPGSQYTNAQVNAFLHQNSTHDFFKRYAPGFTGLDTQLPANTSVSGSCNAFYNGTSTNYYAAGGSCNNTAFSSVVAHEYGHHIVNRLFLAQGGFGEGFGDLMSILQYDDLVVGRYFQTSGGAVRTPDSTNRQYPCVGCAVHASGEVLGGAVCEIRKAMGSKYGSAAGLEATRVLIMDWALDTLGGEGTDSASPRTLNELLIANDNDGNLGNGTPDYCEITSSFAQHNIFPSGSTTPIAVTVSPAVPATMAPQAVQTFTVTFASLCRRPVAGTAQCFARSGTDAFAAVPLTQNSPNTYTVTLTPGSCEQSSFQFYFRTTTTNLGGTGATTSHFPSLDNGVSPSPYVVSIASSSVEAVDAFETNSGWTVGPTTAVTGAWVRVNPVGTSNGNQVQPEDDHSETGTICWVTGNGTSATNVGEADVDGGLTTLVSPNYNFAGSSNATVSYWRWYSNGFGAGPYADTFRVDVSTNGGTTWTNAETVGPASSVDTNGGWRQASWTLQSKGLVPSSQVRLRFIAEDAGIGSLVEAAVDDFRIVATACENPTSCPADYDESGAADGADVEVFFGLWSTGSLRGDFNLDGGIDGADVDAFFAAWSAGC